MTMSRLYNCLSMEEGENDSGPSNDGDIRDFSYDNTDQYSTLNADAAHFVSQHCEKEHRTNCSTKRKRRRFGTDAKLIILSFATAVVSNIDQKMV